MAKLIKVTIEEERKNPLTEEEKDFCSKETLKMIQSSLKDGNLVDDEGIHLCMVGKKMIKVTWSVEEEIKDVTSDVVAQADYIMKPNEPVKDVNENLIEKYSEHDKALAYAQKMPKSRSTGFFMLAAYIQGYDICHNLIIS